MKAEYRRDMNHNYLVLEKEELDTASYQVRILVGNMVPSLLKCRVQGLDGRCLIFYDVTSLQPLSVLYEKKKFRAEDLRLLLSGILGVLEEMSEYLLDPGQLFMTPEYIYVDLEKKEIQFCYFPGYNRELPGQLRMLTEYLLPRLDHEDPQAVMLGYGIYRRTMEDKIRLEDIKEELYRTEEGAEEKKDRLPFLETGPAENSLEKRAEGQPELLVSKESEEILWKRDADEPDKTPLWKVVALCAAGSVVCFGFVSAAFLGYLPWLEVELLLGTAAAAMGGGVLIYFLWKKRRTKANFCADLQTEVPKTEKSKEEKEGEEIRISQKENTKTENFGQTVVLSAGSVCGPATLVSREPGELATIYLQEEITVIGKLSTAADAVVPLPTVSRLHAKIRRKDGEYYLTDLNSRNGTSVNGQLLKEDEEYCLKNEDQVDLAQARYVFLK